MIMLLNLVADSFQGAKIRIFAQSAKVFGEFLYGFSPPFKGRGVRRPAPVSCGVYPFLVTIAIRRAGNGFVTVTIGHPSAGTAFVMVARPLRALAPAVLRPMIVPWVCISDVVLLNTCIFV